MAKIYAVVRPLPKVHMVVSQRFTLIRVDGGSYRDGAFEVFAAALTIAAEEATFTGDGRFTVESGVLVAASNDSVFRANSATFTAIAAALATQSEAATFTPLTGVVSVTTAQLTVTAGNVVFNAIGTTSFIVSAAGISAIANTVSFGGNSLFEVDSASTTIASDAIAFAPSIAIFGVETGLLLASSNDVAIVPGVATLIPDSAALVISGDEATFSNAAASGAWLMPVMAGSGIF